MDSRLLETWLRMSADAVRGADQAQEALEMLGQNPLSPDQANRWLELWTSFAGTKSGSGERASAPTFQEFQRSLEDWWSVMGVVPRYRYTELLRRYEELKERLEKSEETVRHLREILASEGRSLGPEAQRTLAQWEDMTKKTLEAQRSWASAWLPDGDESSESE